MGRKMYFLGIVAAVWVVFCVDWSAIWEEAQAKQSSRDLAARLTRHTISGCPSTEADAAKIYQWARKDAYDGFRTDHYYIGTKDGHVTILDIYQGLEGKDDIVVSAECMTPFRNETWTAYAWGKDNTTKTGAYKRDCTETSKELFDKAATANTRYTKLDNWDFINRDTIQTATPTSTPSLTATVKSNSTPYVPAGTNHTPTTSPAEAAVSPQTPPSKSPSTLEAFPGFVIWLLTLVASYRFGRRNGRRMQKAMQVIGELTPPGTPETKSEEMAEAEDEMLLADF